MASEHNHPPDGVFTKVNPGIINWITEAEVNCGKLFGMLSKQIYTLEKRMDDLMAKPSLHYRLEKYESRLNSIEDNINIKCLIIMKHRSRAK
jgi:hypothetical protein